MNRSIEDAVEAVRVGGMGKNGAARGVRRRRATAGHRTGGALLAWLAAAATGTAATTIVPTFECAGIYWSPSGGGTSVVASVRYRVAGAGTWKDAQPLWFAPAENGRPAEYRGSIVGLRPATSYDVELDLAGTPPPEYAAFETWNDTFPIAQTIQVADSSSPLEINNVHGTADGYVLYTGPATIDVANVHAYNVRIQRSSYVIVRGLTLTGAKGDGILLGPGTGSNSDTNRNIVIEQNDISNWGTVHPSAPTNTLWGYDDQSGIRSSSANLERIVVQRNRIHHPRTDSNSWKEYNPLIGSYHPNGPQGITFENGTKGNFVIRCNEITSDTNHRFNDGMGSDNNFGYGGFPIKDSDVYQNVVTHTWDDGLEIEGANMNVRVWGNYTDETYTGVAMAGVTLGPLYVFRNVFQHSRTSPTHAYGGSAFKRGGSGSYPSNGRIYVYHNTLFYTTSPTFQSGLSNRTDSDYARNTVGRNNILRVRGNTGDKSVYCQSTDSSYDYDLYNGLISTQNPSDESHGIQGLATYVAGAGFDSASGLGVFQLTSASLGFDAGVAIPNFTDGYLGAAPDMGAHEAGAAAMEFGVEATVPFGIVTGPGVWDGGGDGTTWFDAPNWYGDDVPDTAAEDAWIDGNPYVDSVVLCTQAAGAAGTIRDLVVDAGDSLTLTKASGSSTTMSLGSLSNAGTLVVRHTSLSANYQNYTVTAAGPLGTFNTGSLTVQMGGSRRGTMSLSMPADAGNAGALTVTVTSGGSGYSNLSRLALTGSGTFVNDGTISILGNAVSTSINNDANLAVATTGAAVTLGGDGEIVLSSRLQGTAKDSYAQIKGASGATLTQSSGHRIAGDGMVGENTFATLVNHGLVQATGSATALWIDPAGSLVNAASGRLVAVGAGGLMLGSDTTADTFANAGLIEARTGSVVFFGTNTTCTLAGRIRGAGTFAGAPAVTLGAATLEPGNSANVDGTGSSTVGALAIDGNLVLASTTALTWQLGAATTPGGTYDTVAVDGNLTLDGTLTVETLPGYGPGTYRLFACNPGGLVDNGLSFGGTGTLSVNVAAGTVDLVVPQQLQMIVR